MPGMLASDPEVQFTGWLADAEAAGSRLHLFDSRRHALDASSFPTEPAAVRRQEDKMHPVATALVVMLVAASHVGDEGLGPEVGGVPVGVTVRLVPTSRRSRIAPYIGAGVDAFFWKYEEFGDFVAFPFQPGDPIISDSFRSDGVAPGFHVAGGLRLFVSDDFGLTGEVRYTVAKANMKDDFVGNRIDLGGFGATVGVHFRF